MRKRGVYYVRISKVNRYRYIIDISKEDIGV